MGEEGLTGLGDPGSASRLRVWDAPTRAFHWALVALLGFSWWSAETERMEWHVRSGLAVLALLAFRLIWGLIGGSTARFAGFLKGPRAVLGYLRGSDGWSATGHNPLGGWSVIALLLVLVAQVAAGLFAVDVDGLESGPLSYLVDFDQGRAAAEIHELAFHLLQALAALHVLAVLFYLVVRKRNLIAPMLTGSAPADGAAAPGLVPATAWRAMAAAAFALLLAWAVSTGFQF